MCRSLMIAAAVAALLPTGCAGLWDAVTSNSFRKKPFETVQRAVVPEDPLVVLRSDPPRSGDERARAMHRLKEPKRNKGTQEDQDAVIEVLAKTATADPSPVLRYAAVSALGRFEDPRAVQILMLAYQNADGQPPDATPPKPRPETGVVPIGGTSAGRRPTRGGAPDPELLSGPKGFAPDTVAALRCRCLEALGRTNSLEAARFLAAVAGASGPGVEPVGSDNPEIRQAAVRGLTHCRQPESVIALANVLQMQAGKDPTLVRGAHLGLVRLTGKRLPPDPEQWGQVVQAGVVLAPEPGFVEGAIQNLTFWEMSK